jgi:ankyrin repeat protein
MIEYTSNEDTNVMRQIIMFFKNPSPDAETLLEIDQLLDQIDINTHDTRGLYFLHYSTTENNYQITELLLQKGANANVQNFTGETPLLQSARRGSLELVELLIKFGANPDIYDYNQDSSLLWAAYHNHVDIVIFLIQNDADLYHQYKDGRNAVRWAINEKHFAVVEYLCDLIRDTIHTDKHGQTIFEMTTTNDIKNLLREYITKNKISVLRYLLKHNTPLTEYRLIQLIGEFYSP